MNIVDQLEAEQIKKEVPAAASGRDRARPR